MSSSPFFTARRIGYGAVALAMALIGLLVVGIVRHGGSSSSGAPSQPAQPAVPAAVANGSLTATIGRYQTLLRASPDDYQTWAALGAAYVQQARITVDPSYYPKAEGALTESLKLDRAENYPAMVGMASLANARHEFTQAASWGNQAKQISADDPDIYGTLDDAYTQLGDYPAASAAARRMAELQPGVDSFTRGSYELEEHGDSPGARTLLEQALQTAFTPSDAAFCRYYLGELAYHAGDLSEAATQYAASLAVDPGYVAALEGKAKTEALQGHPTEAVADFGTVVSRVPQPQYVMEFAEYLASLGRKTEAAAQAQVLTTEERLFAANGVVDDLTDAEYDVDTGNAAAALGHAQTEWGRRHSVIVADVLGWALHLSGKDAQALGYARFATRLGWHNALFYYHLGTIEAAVGDHADGGRDLALAHAYNPKFDAGTAGPEQGAVIRPLLVGAALTGAILAASATAASAHPLGNFTVNHYDGLVVYPDRVTDFAVIDAAELPTLQDKAMIDTDHNGSVSTAERAGYARVECGRLARGLTARVGSHELTWSVGATGFSYRPGSAGLQTSRLTCGLSAPAALGSTAELDFSDGYRGDRVGWHEITANGSGVGIEHSPVPQRSVSDELLHYPNDLLSSPLDLRSAALRTRAGGISSIGTLPSLPTAGVFSRLINTVTGTFNGLVGSRHLTLSVGLLALLLSVVLGASHAAMPGHGKTVMAAYIAGRRGRIRDAVTVGVTVTFTHTAGVLVLGGLLTASASLAGESLLSYLGVVSGLMVAGIGVGLLRSAWRDNRAAATLAAERAHTGELEPAVAGPGHIRESGAAHGHGHGHGEGHGHGPGEGQGHGHAHGEGHGHGEGCGEGQGHGHGHGRLFDNVPEGRFGRKGLIGLGIAGGLVPSPSALVVLLGAIALGRTVFGVALVLGYGLGMAGTLTAAGLLLVRLRSSLERATITDRLSRMTRLTLVTPLLTAALVIIVGAGLVIRSLSGTV